MSIETHSIMPRTMPTRETVMAVISDNRGWFLAMGAVLLITGVAALTFPLASSVAVEMIVGVAFAVAGIAYVAQSFSARGFGGFAWEAFVGLVYLAAGVFMLVRPVEGTAVLTLVVAFTFVADGIARTALSIVMRRGGWGWMLAGGLVSIALGIAAIAMFPITAVWLLGVMVGINFIASGATLMIVVVTAPETDDVTGEHAAE